MATFVVDTNFFIQCKAPAELPWSDITEESEIVLLVPHAVQEEIDRQKQDGSGRRSTRARAANSTFRRALLAEDAYCVLREAKPRVVLRLLERMPAPGSLPASLDLTHNDDRIVADVLSLREQHIDVKLLTGDAGPLMTARRHGAPSVPIPEDGWLLPPEPDRQAKELGDLRRRLEALERTGPEIGMRIVNQGSGAIGEITIRVIAFERDEQLIDEAVERLKTRAPMLSIFDTLPSGRPPLLEGLFGQAEWQPPTPEAIRTYQEEEYPKWLEDAREFLKDELSAREHASRCAFVRAVLENSGVRPAENTVVDVIALGGLQLVSRHPEPDDEDAGIDGLPEPPTPPSGSWKTSESLDMLRNMARYAQQSPWSGGYNTFPTIATKDRRDRYAFYWSPQRPSGPAAEWRFECDEFRHQLDPESLSIGIYVPVECPAGRKAIQVRASAANMATPVTLVLPVIVEVAEQSSSILIDELVDAWKPKSGS